MVATARFTELAFGAAASLGLEGPRIATVDHPVGGIDEAESRVRAVQAAAAIGRLWTA